MSVTIKRKAFSLDEKLKILREYDETELNLAKFAAKLNIPQSTLRTIIKNRKNIENHVILGGIKRKKVRCTKYQDLERNLLNWFYKTRTLKIPINGPTLKGKAQEVADSLGFKNFTASNGWLGRFKLRHNIIYKKLSRGGVSMDVRCNFKTDQLPKLIQGYEPKDIYSVDEFGLLYKLMPHEIQLFKKNKRRLKKQRFSIIICTNSIGTDRLKLFVIGEKINTSGTNNINSSLPCNYLAQSFAWITADCFTSWLYNWNEELKINNRKIILFLDNSKTHPPIELSNIKLSFLPLTVIKQFQPLRQGVIKALKLGYRKFILQKYLKILETPSNIYNICNKKISHLEALQYLAAAWANVNSNVIFNCFKNLGFISNCKNNEIEPYVQEEDEELQKLMLKANLQSMDDFVSIDDDVVTSIETYLDDFDETFSYDKKMVDNEEEEEEEEEDAEEIVEEEENNCSTSFANVKRENDEMVDEQQDPLWIPNKTDAINALKTIQSYFNACTSDSFDDVFHHIKSIEDHLMNEPNVIYIKQEYPTNDEIESSTTTSSV